jgi:heme a synthase
MTQTLHFTSRALSYWLFTCCVLIAAMIVIGAITRLTESGLSMVEWRAMMDMLPPLSEAAWVSEFQKYQLTPEYLKTNHGMELDAFKNIYFWEWLHRLLGRVIGIVYAGPLVYFWAVKKIPPKLIPRFLVFLFLGGLQGFFGWYMVKSGLINEPRVSHYRLALHLGTAFVLLCLLWVQALKLHPRIQHIMHHYATPFLKKYMGHALLSLGVISITILWGAFVAGLDAGMVYNEFPLMGGKIIPGELLAFTPWWQNFLTNHASVQWLHRVLGTLSFLIVFSLGLRCAWQGNAVLKTLGYGLMGLITLQFMLGIGTLLSHVAVPVATLHQSGAVIVLLTLLTTLTFLNYRRD